MTAKEFCKELNDSDFFEEAEENGISDDLCFKEVGAEIKDDRIVISWKTKYWDEDSVEEALDVLEGGLNLYADKYNLSEDTEVFVEISPYWGSVWDEEDGCYASRTIMLKRDKGEINMIYYAIYFTLKYKDGSNYSHVFLFEDETVRNKWTNHLKDLDDICGVDYFNELDTVLKGLKKDSEVEFIDPKIVSDGEYLRIDKYKFYDEGEGVEVWGE